MPPKAKLYNRFDLFYPGILIKPKQYLFIGFIPALQSFIHQESVLFASECFLTPCRRLNVTILFSDWVLFLVAQAGCEDTVLRRVLSSMSHLFNCKVKLSSL